MPDETITDTTELTPTERVKRFREDIVNIAESLAKVTEATSLAFGAMREAIEMLGETKIGERINAVLDQERLAASIPHDRATIDAAIESFELETGTDYPESGFILFAGPDDPLRESK